MHYLILNVGSSSVKYAVYKDDKLLGKNNIERVLTPQKRRLAVKSIQAHLSDEKIIPDALGHRVVHGFTLQNTVPVSLSLIHFLKKVAELAPLHDIAEIEVMEHCHSIFPCKQYAVFDTSFFKELPTKAKIYGLPYKYFKKGIHRYGFHGLSHAYVTKGLKGMVISCHLGSGCSITALKNGKPIDTSMGFTPLEGPIMGTRSGSLDPAIVPYLMEHQKLSLKRISVLLNDKSGLLGISGISNDFRDLMKSHSGRAKLALEVFIYQVSKIIGSYMAALQGLDILVFTAGIGERNAYLRQRILENFGYMGIKLDEHKNEMNEKIISKASSKVKVMVIPTDEEKMILEEVQKKG